MRRVLCSHDVLVMSITCIMFCVTRLDDGSQDFGLFKAKQRENPKRDVFLIQGFCLEKPNSSEGFEVPTESLGFSDSSQERGKKTACLLIKTDYCWKLLIVSFY